jgi:hypothetical protein
MSRPVAASCNSHAQQPVVLWWPQVLAQMHILVLLSRRERIALSSPEYVNVLYSTSPLPMSSLLEEPLKHRPGPSTAALCISAILSQAVLRFYVYIYILHSAVISSRHATPMH